MRRLTMLLLIGLSLLAFSPLVSPAQELALSVAISMKEATEELGRRFQESRSGVRLRYNFGASGALQQQIEAGAPVDLFISAGDAQYGCVGAEGPAPPGQPPHLREKCPRGRCAGRRPTSAGPAGRSAAGGHPADRHRESQDRSRRPVRRGEPAVACPLEYVARSEVEAGIGSSRSTAGPSTSCRPERISRPDRKTFRKDSMASPSVRIQQIRARDLDVKPGHLGDLQMPTLCPADSQITIRAQAGWVAHHEGPRSARPIR